MLQAANTDFFNPIVPKAHISECQNLLIPLQLSQSKSVKASLRIFISWTLGINGLSAHYIAYLGQLGNP